MQWMVAGILLILVLGILPATLAQTETPQNRCESNNGTCQEQGAACGGKIIRRGCDSRDERCCTTQDTKCTANRDGVCQNTEQQCDGYYLTGVRFCRHHPASTLCCVDGCVDDGSRNRKPDSTWKQNRRKKQCTCEDDGTGDYAISCQYLGCPDFGSSPTTGFNRPDKILPAGSSAEDPCTCVEGDANLPEYLYEWDCVPDGAATADGCAAANRALGDVWDDNDEHGNPTSCVCKHVGQVQGGPPTVTCRPTGCLDRGTFYEEGDQVFLANGDDCECVNGTRPDLADDYSLFHWQCPPPPVDVGTPSCTEDGVEYHPAETWTKTVGDDQFRCVCVPGQILTIECELLECEDENGAWWAAGDHWMKPHGNGESNCTCKEGQVAGHKGVMCLLLGCLDSDDFTVVGSGHRIIRVHPMNGKESLCECMEGQDPNIADQETAFHYRCEDVQPGD